MNDTHKVRPDSTPWDLVEALRCETELHKSSGYPPRNFLDEFRQRVMSIKCAMSRQPREGHPRAATLSHITERDICDIVLDIPSPERYEYLDVLLQQGASLNPKWISEESLMVQAVGRADSAMIAHLASKGYPFGESVDTAGNNLLSYAVVYGHEQLLEPLIAYGEKINAGPECLVPPLHRAIESDDEHMVRRLLALGASPHIRDENCHTPAVRALDSGCVNAFKALVEAGVDVKTAPNFDSYLAASHEREACLDILNRAPRQENSERVAESLSTRPTSRGPTL